MFRSAWRMARKAAKILAMVLLVLVVAESLRFVLLFYRIHPILGMAAGAVLFLVGLRLLLFLIFASRPLDPPELPDIAAARHDDMRRYCKYLSLLFRQLSANRYLASEPRNVAFDKTAEIDGVLRAHPLNEDLLRAIQQAEQELLPPIFEQLGGRAEPDVREAAARTMLGLAGGPYESVESAAAIGRGLAATARVIDIYAHPAGLRARFCLLGDALRVCLEADESGFTRRVLDHLSSRSALAPDRAVALARGLTGAWMTIFAARAAADRCSALRNWEPARAATRILGTAQEISNLTAQLFTEQVATQLRGRLRTDSVAADGGEAIDQTARTALMEAARAIAAKPPAAAQAPTNPTTSHGESHRHRRHAPRRKGLLRVAQTFGQRIKYGFLGRQLRGQ